MRILVKTALIGLAALGLVTPAAAQEARGSLALKAGVTSEHSEDGLTGTVPAIGATAGWRFASGWGVEVELWVPGYLEDARGEPKHRDILFSGAVVRRFGSARARPYLLAGLSLTRTEDWFTLPRGRVKNVGTDGYLLTGGGVEVTMSRRLALVADVRVSLAPVSVLVRPGIGLALTF